LNYHSQNTSGTKRKKEENPNTFGKGNSPNMKCFYDNHHI